jgi:hypothetical protein
MRTQEISTYLLVVHRTQSVHLRHTGICTQMTDIV